MKSSAVDALDKAFELASRIGEAMQAALSERNLTPARAGLLLALHQHGRPMLQRELSQKLGCTPRHVTALVDALEAHGWVSRGPHPTDRRATLVALTGQGTETANWMATQRRESAHALLAHLPSADLAGFISVANHLLHHIGSATPTDTPAEAQDADTTAANAAVVAR
jgi:DNA-binding MarR family transcriptional regulator